MVEARESGVYGLFEKVKLRDGTIGHVVEVFDGGAAYIVDYAVPDGKTRYDQIVVESNQILGVTDEPEPNPYPELG